MRRKLKEGIFRKEELMQFITALSSPLDGTIRFATKNKKVYIGFLSEK